jgi:hypothetical protein
MDSKRSFGLGAVCRRLAWTWPGAAEKAMRHDVVQTDFQRLEGKWVRPDGGYVLELRNIKMNGSLTAGYFNPRPIKVFRAEAAKKDGTMTLVVELRDVNYPGSTYKLQYDPATDRLKGKYFQAVERQTFDVEFQRMR